MKVEPKSDEMTDASCSGFDSSDDDTGEVDLSPLEISWLAKYNIYITHYRTRYVQKRIIFIYITLNMIFKWEKL